ncbi:MAG: AAA family ATPase [Actinomycetota bacterium]|nr:AAA family ATPase [Actinomycetota bacterium]
MEDPRRRYAPTTAAAALDALLTADHHGGTVRGAPLPTGFDVLDTTLGGGIGPTDLVLLAGLPGVGKTVAALQVARHHARSGGDVVYACYEHTAGELLTRLLLMELGQDGDHLDPHLELLREAVRDCLGAPLSFRALVDREPLLAAAIDRLRGYSDRLWLVSASGAHTGVGELADLVEEHLAGGGLLIVDYLQKVAVRPEPPDEAEKVTRIAEALKDLALTRQVPVLAVTAADRSALDAPRLRLHHLRGSSALAYEADVAVILNDKSRCVSKVHLAYDTVRAEGFRHSVVFSVEKNRGGPALVDLEFRKDFAHYRFDPQGDYVRERLVDERLNVE